MSKRLSRRRVIRGSVAAVGVLLTGRAHAQEQKLRLAVIGVGGRGKDNLKGVAGEEIVALCDVDEGNLAKAAEEFDKAKRYHDWRRMLDAEGRNIDGVVISTPDHTHAGPLLAALALGKHVYCEKPLTHTVEENRKALLAARKAGAKVATQMGTQIHAGENYRRVVELVRAGAVGAIKRIHVYVPGSQHGGERPTDTPVVPKGLHWDLWLGPAPDRAYHPAYAPFKWRGWWDYGGGQLSDLACHHMDLSHWALGLRTAAAVHAHAEEPDADCPPKAMVVDFWYPSPGEGKPPVHLTWYHGWVKPDLVRDGTVDGKAFAAGTIFVGEKGLLVADYGKHRLLPAEKFEGFERPEKSIPKSIGHHAEWIKAAKEGGETTCNFEYACPLAETVLLGNVSHRLGNVRLEWDSAGLSCRGRADAGRFLGKEYRKGWEV